MAVHELDLATFRALFPEFADTVTTPDVVVSIQWGAATAFVSPSDGPLLCGDQLQTGLNYMTAHLLKLAKMQAAGETAAVVRGSQVDKVRVDLQPPPTKSAWQWWLSTTPYGAMLWAMLDAASAGGFYIGGRPEQSAFRHVGGRFW